MIVLQQFMASRSGKCLPCPLPGFAEHYTVLVELLHAYATVAGKPEGWTDSQVAGWSRAFTEAVEPEEDELEHPIRSAAQSFIHDDHDMTMNKE